jgi:hypothetical protein
MFNIWLRGSEVEWAKAAWQALERKGLSKYTDEVGRTMVLIRFVALAEMYREFCHTSGLEQMDLPPYDDWAGDLEISSFRLGQLVGIEFGALREASDCALREEALRQLVNQVRREVFDALVARFFGSTWSLFASLWVTQQAGVDFANLDEKTLNELDFDCSGQLAEGFLWVDQGMPEVETGL